MTSRDPLTETLQSWRHHPTEDTQFQAAVWTRIHAEPMRRTSPIFYRWALPIAASLALVAGIGFAVQQTRLQHREQMAIAYIQTIDPLQMHASNLP
jgi:hypothetical protein